METPHVLGLIAGSGAYPLSVARAARQRGVQKIVAAAFTGETDEVVTQLVDEVHWLRVGQLAKLLSAFRGSGVTHAMMTGQIAPQNLFNLRPDWKALLLLARLKRRNAETIFGAIADELHAAGIELLPATTFLEEFLASSGVITGRELKRSELDDVAFGLEIAKEMSRLDVGQTVVVKGGTVLAVEAFEGTNEAIKRGGVLAGKAAVVVKVAKPNQDMRFDVPVIGTATIRVAAQAHVRVIAVEAGRTLLLERDELLRLAREKNITIVGC
ncbi:MAG: LpxI family protein [Chthoniobacterales bacterium]